MSSIELNIHQKDEIVLPAAIAISRLTLAQIGAVTCMMCLERFGDGDAMLERIQSAEMQGAMKELAALNVINAEKTGNTVNLRINLSDVIPP